MSTCIVEHIYLGSSLISGGGTEVVNSIVMGPHRAPVVTALYFWVLLAGCGPKDQTAKTKGGPDLFTATPVMDLGEVGSYAPIKVSFELHNRGNEQAVLEKIEADCACTVSELSQKVVEPDMSLSIPVTINTRGQSGTQSRRVSVLSNSKGQSPLTIDISYSIRDYISVVPPVLGLEYEGGGKNPIGEIEVRSVDNTPFRIQEVSLPEYLKYSVRDYDEKTSSCLLVFELTKPLELGMHEGVVELKTTAKGHPNIEIPTKVNIRESLTADVSSVYLGEVQKGKPTSFTVLVSRLDLTPFRISRVHTSHEDIQASYGQGENTTIEVAVTLTAVEPGAFEDLLEIQGDPGKNEVLRIPIRATVK